MWKTAFLFGMVWSSAAMSQTNYPLEPFQCPTEHWVYGFNPATHGLPGWFCQKVKPTKGGIGGQFSCVRSVTIKNGIVTAAVAGSCS
jgi:hypothetical protein